MPVFCFKPFSITINPGGGATFAVWFRRVGMVNNQYVFIYRSNPGGSEMRIIWNADNTLTVHVPAISTGTSAVMADVDPAVWNLVLVTWSKSDGLIRCYVNDVLRVETGSSADFSTGATNGVLATNGANLDDYYWDQLVAWCSELLSAAQRTAFYAGSSGEVYPFPGTIPTPTAVWSFDNTLVDSVLSIAMQNLPAHNDFQPGKFAQCFHALPGPAVFNLSTSGQSALKIP